MPVGLPTARDLHKFLIASGAAIAPVDDALLLEQEAVNAEFMRDIGIMRVQAARGVRTVTVSEGVGVLPETAVEFYSVTTLTGSPLEYEPVPSVIGDFRPAVMLKFKRFLQGEVAVDADWGWSQDGTVPTDVWQVLLRRAAWRVLAVTNPVIADSIREGDVAISGISRKQDTERDYIQMVRRYRVRW